MKKYFAAILCVAMFFGIFSFVHVDTKAAQERLVINQASEKAEIAFDTLGIAVEEPNQTRSEINENGEVKIQLSYGENLVVDYVESEIDTIANFAPIVEAATQVFGTSDLNETIDSIFELSAMDVTYALTESRAFDEDYWQMTWLKKYGDLENPYESVKVVVNRYTKELVVYKRFDEAPNTLFPALTAEQAMESIVVWLDALQVEAADVTYQLEFTKANYDQETNTIIEPYGDVRVTYNFSFADGGYSIYVDACTGECIAFSQLRDAARAFSVGNESAFPNPEAQTEAARSCFHQLGYLSLYPIITDDMTTLRSQILTFLARSDAYGFYIASHGTPADQTRTLYGNTDTVFLRPADISGNWKFVFIDACYSAQNTDWSNSFNITSTSTNRAFLGWYDQVGGPESLQFSNYFFPEVINGYYSDNIRDAAVWAASQVPGSGTTPIRFYGDRTYNGVI